jgi:hypothetical protein
MKSKSAEAAPLQRLTALELESNISTKKAAKVKGISKDTFKRHYGHLIKKVSPRREVVKLRDVIES